jgi:hypothetical protein
MDANRCVLQTRVIFTISQLIEIDYLTGRLTSDKNRVLFDELAVFPQLQDKLSLLVRSMHRALVMDRFLAHNTMASYSFLLG